MKFIQIATWVFFLAQMTFSLTIAGQSPLPLNKDSLKSSFKIFLEDMNSNTVGKEFHFLKNEGFDYFNSINSSDFLCDLSKVLKKIELPFEQKQMAEITFVKLYDWTEANSTWFITLVDSLGDHYIYLYEFNTGMEKPYMCGVERMDFFYRLAENLYQVRRCEEMNEDYIITGRIIGSKFTSYFSSQTYHRMDIVFFNDLLKALSN
jgi:hypothetical protein